jgi:hypothetical protein
MPALSVTIPEDFLKELMRTEPHSQTLVVRVYSDKALPA